MKDITWMLGENIILNMVGFLCEDGMIKIGTMISYKIVLNILEILRLMLPV